MDNDQSMGTRAQSKGAGEIAKVIGEHLTRRGWSRNELGRRTGITGAQISMLMTGRRRWHLDQLEKVAAALGVDLAVITGAPASASTQQLFCCELSPGDARIFRQLAADQLRPPENLLHWVVLEYIRTQRAQRKNGQESTAPSKP